MSNALFVVANIVMLGVYGYWLHHGITGAGPGYAALGLSGLCIHMLVLYGGVGR